MNPTGNKCVNTGAPGSCELDKDCNAPNGQCFKNDQGECGCVCKVGFSGKNCEIKGVPWDSPNCMGPNSQWPAKKDKDGMCVCPSENWADGQDPKFGYVQCLKCAGDWGPLAGDSPCMNKWMEKDLLGKRCISNSLTSEVAWCKEFGPLVQYPGPTGQQGTINLTKKCAGAPYTNSCRCSHDSSRGTCQVTGWLPPNTLEQTCDGSMVERPCSGYECIW